MLLITKFTLFCLVLAFRLGSSPTIADAASYPEELSQRAAEMKLHEERGWEVLLHYVGRWNGGYASTIDDANFFLAEAGRTDGKAELEATVKSMFVTGLKDGEHVACRFPARFEWLVDRLSIDTAHIPAFSCSERDAELQAVEAKSAVLVFPVGHINSPASMFGHTLIRIDGSSRSNLLSHAVNYSAQTTDTNGFVYAWKGMTGMYKGYYSLMPYYQKVQEYNDLEHRDMWEYQLSFTEPEVKRMLNHIWELHKISSPYYFMDRNCSYNLLFLLEAARPELHLTEKTGLLVLPTNTIQAVINSGIVSKVNYRPSQGTKLKKIISALDADAQKKAHSIALGREKPEGIADNVSVDDKMKMLDLAAGFVQYRFARGEMEKDAYSKLYLGVLAERSKLGVAPAVSEADEPERPESGHDTAKIAVGGGVRRGRAFAELNLRPQFHGLIDPDAGYLRGAQIHFLDTKVRYSFPSSDFQLKSLHVVDIFSVAPRDTFFKPISWKVNTGLDYELLGTGKDHYIYRLNTGGGLSFSSPWGGIVYGLGEIDVNAGEKIPARVAVGSGISAGYLEEVAGWWKCHLQLTGMWYKLGDDRQSLKASFGQNFRVSRNNSVELVVSSETVNEFHVFDAAMLWKHFF